MRRLARASFAGSSDDTGSSRGRFRRAFAALAGTGTMALVLALFGAPAASAAPWGFEQVSPVNKGAGSVSTIDTFTVAPDGESILYSAILPFEEVPTESIPLYTRYLAERGPEKWINHPTDPPYDIGPEGTTTSAIFGVQATLRASNNLRYALVISSRAMAPGAIGGGGNLYIRDTRTGAYTLVVATPDITPVARALSNEGQNNYLWVAQDGRSAMFANEFELIPGIKGPYMYAWTAEGGIEVVSRLPEDAAGEKPLAFLFTAGGASSGPREPLPVNGALTNIYMNGGNTPAYRRTAGKTVPVSVSHLPGELGAPTNAEVVSVGEGGKYMLFLTKGYVRLTPTTPEVGSGKILYRYDAGDGSLTYLGSGSTSAGGIQVMQMSRDGQTVAFTSKTAVGGLGTEGTGIANLYVWRKGTLHYVYSTDKDSTISKYLTSRTLNVLSKNGRYLFFTDNSNSLSESFGFNSVSLACAEAKKPEIALPCDQAYLYDIEATSDQLACVSCPPGGEPAAGRGGDPFNSNSGYTRFNNHQTQNVANDGRTFFTTPEALLPEDSNGLDDVYEYDHGDLRLVSTAAQGARARLVDASDDGKSIFFTTGDAIVPQDVDKAVDLYMTREGAGYPYDGSGLTPPCLGLGVCHGGASSAAALPAPGSASFSGQGNAADRAAVGTIKIVKASARGTTATLKVKVPGAGSLEASAPGIKVATKRTAKAGTVTLKLKLTGQAARALKKSGRSKQAIEVTYTTSGGGVAGSTATVTFKAPAKHKGGK